MAMSDQDSIYANPSDTWLALYLEQNYQNGGYPRMSLQDNKVINTSYGTPPINPIGVPEKRSNSGHHGQHAPNHQASRLHQPPRDDDPVLYDHQTCVHTAPSPRS